MGTVHDNYLKIRLNNHIILILLKHIHSVLPIAELQTIPGKTSVLAGMLNFHGQALTVYHLAEFIGDSKPQYDLNTPLIICTLATNLVGLLVSEVIEVISLNEDMIQAPQANNAPLYVTGIVEKEEGSAWILDLESLLEFHHLGEKAHG